MRAATGAFLYGGCYLGPAVGGYEPIAACTVTPEKHIERVTKTTQRSKKTKLCVSRNDINPHLWNRRGTETKQKKVFGGNAFSWAVQGHQKFGPDRTEPEPKIEITGRTGPYR